MSLLLLGVTGTEVPGVPPTFYILLEDGASVLLAENDDKFRTE
jgi:hypothetical protein